MNVKHLILTLSLTLAAGAAAAALSRSAGDLRNMTPVAECGDQGVQVLVRTDPPNGQQETLITADPVPS